MSAVCTRNNVTVLGEGKQVLMLAHGYGCDQNMWRLITPAFRQDYKIVLFDHVGCGRSDLSAYDPLRYFALEAYADDVLRICAEMELEDVIFVGHSVSAMIGMLAAIQEPKRFAKLVMVAPSPCYIDDDNYRGGFSREDIEGLLELLDRNYLGWTSSMAPVIMGNPEHPEYAQELEASFCRTDPDIAKAFARATFLSDYRAFLPKLNVPTLVMQCSEDLIAPVCVGEYVRDQIPNSAYVHLKARGHCPHLSAPEETATAIRQFL